MVIVFIGSSKSDCVIDASKYLANKYLPDFCKIYLKYDGELEFWGQYVSGFLEYLQDEQVMLGLDDFLFSDYINKEEFVLARLQMTSDDNIACAKLCDCTEEEQAEYPVTTQMTIWRRDYLIYLLKNTNSPWNFERAGSLMFNKKAILRPCIKYDTNSATSYRWEGVKINGLKEEDISELKSLGYIE